MGRQIFWVGIQVGGNFFRSAEGGSRGGGGQNRFKNCPSQIDVPLLMAAPFYNYCM